MRRNRWQEQQKSDSIFLFSSPPTSFFSIRKLREERERGSFRWSNVLLFFHHWRVVMVCCVHFQMPFFPSQPQYRKCWPYTTCCCLGFSKHWKIANNLTLRRSCWIGKNRKSTSNSTRKYTSKAFLWLMANPQASTLEYIQAYRNWKEKSLKIFKL